MDYYDKIIAAIPVLLLAGITTATITGSTLPIAIGGLLSFATLGHGMFIHPPGQHQKP